MTFYKSLKLHINKCDFHTFTSSTALDLGTVFHKVVYVDESDDSWNSNIQNSSIIFSCALFHASDSLISITNYVKTKQTKSIDLVKGTIVMCGGNSEKFQNEIQKELHADVINISSFDAAAIGMHYLVRTCAIKSLTYPSESIKFESGGDGSKIAEGIRKEWAKKFASIEDDKTDFPFLFVDSGTVSQIMIINEDGSFEKAAMDVFGGATFSGLSNCLLNETNYVKVLDLANSGKRENVDTQIKDIFDGGSTPYGDKLNMETPVFSFGKASNLDMDKIPSFSQCDVASALVSMFMQQIAIYALQVAFSIKVKRIYYGGNFLNHALFRKEYVKLTERVAEVIPNEFLKSGFETTLGLLIATKVNKKDDN